MEIREKNGAGETPTTKTSGTIRFKAADDANVDLADPIVRPGSGNAYSVEKVLRLYMGATGPTGAITSPRAFSDGVSGFGTGVTMHAGISGSYTQPVFPAADSTIATGGPIDGLFDYTSGSPLAMDVTNTGPYTSSVPGTSSDFADYLYLQATVASTASPGLTPSETLTIAYDET